MYPANSHIWHGSLTSRWNGKGRARIAPLARLTGSRRRPRARPNGCVHAPATAALNAGACGFALNEGGNVYQAAGSFNGEPRATARPSEWMRARAGNRGS
jgi:hypothetical protein